MYILYINIFFVILTYPSMFNKSTCDQHLLHKKVTTPSFGRFFIYLLQKLFTLNYPIQICAAKKSLFCNLKLS